MESEGQSSSVSIQDDQRDRKDQRGLVRISSWLAGSKV